MEQVVRSAIDRAQETGRWGSLADLPAIHRSAQESILEIARHFEGDDRLGVSFFLNEGTRENPAPARELSLEQIDRGGEHSYGDADDTGGKTGVEGEVQGSNPGGFVERGRKTVHRVFAEAVESGAYDDRVLGLLAQGDPVLEALAGVEPSRTESPQDPTGSPPPSDPVGREGTNYGPGAANVDEPLGEIPEGWAESASYRTIKDAIDRGDFAPGIEDYLPSLYEKESRKEWVDQAIAEVAEEGESTATANVMRAFQDGRQKPKDVAKLAFLSKNYEIQRKRAEAEGDRQAENRFAMVQQDLLGAYMEAQTDIARVLNSGYLIRHLAPDGQIRALIQATNAIGKKRKRNERGEDADISTAAANAIERTRRKPGRKQGEDITPGTERDAERTATESEAEAINAADGAAQSLADRIAEFFSDTPNLSDGQKRTLTDLARFLADSRKHSGGRDAWTRETFDAAGGKLGVEPATLDNLWNSITAGNTQSKASKVATDDLKRQETDRKHIRRVIDDVLRVVSDTPDLREKVARAESALSSFLADARSHAKGADKFPDRDAFDAAARKAGVKSDQAGSLWNAIGKAHSDARAYERIKADLAAQRKARRDDLIASLQRQWGKTKLDKVMKSKGRMIDALLDGERPEKAVDDFYSAVDLPSGARTRILDLLEQAERAQGAYRATILDEAKKIVQDSMPPQWLDALLDSFRGSIFSGLGTQAISVVGTVGNSIANLAGHMVTDIQKSRQEGVKFGRTSAALKGVFSKDTLSRAEVAFKSVWNDLPIGEQVAWFGSGNTLKYLMDREGTSPLLYPWLLQHWVFRAMGAVDQTLKSFVFRSEAGVLAYEGALESGLSGESAVKAVFDQGEMLAKD